MAIEEICAQLPRDFKREDPNASKPHASMIVEVPGLDEFANPMVETVDPCSAINGLFVAASQRCIPLQLPHVVGEVPAIAKPNFGTVLQPAFEVSTPEHFRNELFGGLFAMLGERLRQHFFLEKQTMADPR